MKPLEIDFITNKPKIEVIAGVDGKKKVIIMGTLMNANYNYNNWRIISKDGPTIASEFRGNPLKMAHGDDWTIIGEGIDATYDSNNEINYKTSTSNPEAVEKFENGEWTASNMGISPKIRYDKAECSICGEDVRECSHVVGNTYDNKVCQVTLHGSHLVEHSLTSEPAYKDVGAGNIEEVMMAAIEGGKMEEKEKKELEAKIREKDKLVAEKDKVIAEKEGEIEDLNDKVSELTKKAEEPPEKGEGEDEGEGEGGEPPEKPPEKSPEKDEGSEEKLKETETKLEESEKKLAKTEEKLDVYVKAERQAKLEKVFDKEKNKDLISSILEQKLPVEDFDRKISELEAVKQFSASNEGSGSLPADDNDKTSFEALWGSSEEDVLKGIVASSNKGAGE